MPAQRPARLAKLGKFFLIISSSLNAIISELNP